MKILASIISLRNRSTIILALTVACCGAILLYLKLSWLAIFLVFSVVFYKLVFSLASLTKPLLLSMMSFINVFLLVVFIRTFIFELYNIPSASMKNCLVIGDKIIVQKLAYGPILPRETSEIAWVNLFIDNLQLGKKNTSYRRLHGYSIVKSSDIVLFKDVYGNGMNIVKRCIGLPGDQFTINSGGIFIESRRVHMLDESSNLSSTSKVETHPGIKTKWYRSFIRCLTKSVPVSVPQKGKSILITDSNYDVYSFLLKNHEEVIISKNKNEYYINGTISNKYVFKNNYYFMLGDNHDNSIDSRSFGFVPEYNIIGKASIIIFSSTKGVVVWDRIFSIIR